MSSASTERHRRAAAESGSVCCAIVTVSDSRTPETDESGALIRDHLERAGHRIAFYEIVQDEPERIVELLDRIVDETEARVVLFNGGTGIARRDTTYDALSRRLEKTLPGFGEIFRMLSFLQIGPAAILSRATAGVYRGRLVISMPGSPNAVRLALEKIIVPELAHLVWELSR